MCVFMSVCVCETERRSEEERWGKKTGKKWKWKKSVYKWHNLEIILF